MLENLKDFHYHMSMIEVKPLGVLTPHKIIPELLVSNPINVPFFGGKAVEFTIDEEDLSPTMKPKVEEVVVNFLKLAPEYRFDLTDYVYANYKEMIDTTSVKPLSLENRDAIWKYVYPKGIHVERDRDDIFYIDCECDCEWEIEHGLEFVFKHGNKINRISQYHNLLSEGFDPGLEYLS